MKPTFIFTIDAEWAPEPIFADLLGLFEAAAIPVTVFATDKPVISVGAPHELALHPNIQAVDRAQQTLQSLQALYPTAKGVRTHALFSSTYLHSTLVAQGFSYHSNTFTQQGFSKAIDYGDGLPGFPIFYMDHVNVTNPSINPEFRVEHLEFGAERYYVFDFHPVLAYINCYSNQHYQQAKQAYHDPQALRQYVNTSVRGVRNLLEDLIRYVQAQGIPTCRCIDLLT